MMKVLITGMNGFVGPYVAALLKDSGYEVFGIDRSRSVSKSGVLYGDILDVNFIEETLRDVAPNYIIHLAGFSSVGKSFDEPDLCVKVNVEGTRNILEASRKIPNKTRIVIITSAEVYGTPRFIPITEEHPLDPQSPYGVSRLMQEKLVSNYRDLDIIILRSFNHTGPGQKPPFVIADFAKQIDDVEKGLQKPVLRVGNLQAIRDFIDVRDIALAYKVAMEKAKSHMPYNICSGQGYKIQTLLEKLIEFSGLKIDIVQDQSRMLPTDIPKLIGSHEKFTRDTSWAPQITVEQTLRHMLNHA